MKNYLKQNPKKLIAPIFVMLFGIAANVAVNYNFESLALSFFVGFFTALITLFILLQVWGEYKGIEGFTETFKQFFRW
jgi:hypothetical protein